MNYKGTYYLCLKEVKRLLAVWKQTILGPVITSLMFLFMFSVVVKTKTVHLADGVTFSMFLIPGLTMMQVLQNTFASTSSTMIMSKMFGTIGDILTAPLSSTNIAVAFIMGAVVRGFVISFVIVLSCSSVSYFINGDFVYPHYIGWSVVYLFLGGYIMGAAGLICGLWALNFDKVAGIANMIVMPLTFLSGTFYSISALPHSLQVLNLFNPIFLSMDGFRYSFIGVSHLPMYREWGFLLLLALILHLFCVYLIKTGYKIRS